MENTALVLIIVTLFLLAIIVGLLTMLVFKIMKQGQVINQKAEDNGDAPHPDVSKSEFHPAILARMKGLEKVKTKRPDVFCANHPEESGEVVCAVCDTLFCKACVKPFKSMHLCKEHLALVMRHDWDEVLTLKTSTTDPEQGVKLYEVKKDLYQNDELPTYIETHYKINVDQDFIETYLVLFGIKQNVPVLKEKLQSFIH